MNAFKYAAQPAVSRKLILGLLIPTLAQSNDADAERKVLIKVSDKTVMFIGADGSLTHGTLEWALAGYSPVPHQGLTVSIEVRATA